MPGLVPGIHVLALIKDADGRGKRGHDQRGQRCNLLTVIAAKAGIQYPRASVIARDPPTNFTL